MIQGLYAAATGMIALEDRQAVIANNIANASTAGYKRQNAIQEGFNEVFLGKLATPQRLNVERGPGGGLKLIHTYTDLAAGPVAVNGNPLNVALQGPGYLAVETPRGERFTRSGVFTVDADGQLATPEGYKVLDSGGSPIDVSGGAVTFDALGFIYVNNQNAGQLRLLEFADPHYLEREGHNLFALAEGAPDTALPAEQTAVIPGAVEGSNVQLPFEMAQMMWGMRAYNANQKVINSVDETVGRLINDVGAPA